MVPGPEAILTEPMLSVAIIADLAEERWPSMDLVAQMIHDHLALRPGQVHVDLIKPTMRRRLSGPATFAGRFYNFDRLCNRFWDYPRALRRLRDRYDVFHVIDQSYAQLVHELPAARTIVTCNDLDVFRSVLDSNASGRPFWFRVMTRRVLSGFRKAAFICCISDATRKELEWKALVPPERVMTLHIGVHPSFKPEADALAGAKAERLLGGSLKGAGLLHVGSTIPRKRIDLLLTLFAAISRSLPDARLIRVGGSLTPAQERLAERLGIADRVISLPFLEPAVLAAVYRRSDLLLLTSESEGFGLPILEAMACGTPVAARGIPAAREVGGDAIVYLSGDDPEIWAAEVIDELRELKGNPARLEDRVRSGLRQAAQFSWDATADRLIGIYQQVIRPALETGTERSQNGGRRR